MKREVKTGASNLHKETFDLVAQCFPQEGIKQEEPIKINGKTLYLDIYLPRLKIAVECDGIQHSIYNKFFHVDAMAFRQQKENDRLKEEFCAAVGITLVRINYNEQMDKNKLKDKILKTIKD